jgi:hypothetical protein
LLSGKEAAERTDTAANFAKFTGYYPRRPERVAAAGIGFKMQSVRVFCCRFAADSAAISDMVNR